jgi:hypothetical protein
MKHPRHQDYRNLSNSQVTLGGGAPQRVISVFSAPCYLGRVNSLENSQSPALNHVRRKTYTHSSLYDMPGAQLPW